MKIPEDAMAYERSKAMSLPVVFGEIVDELDEVYKLTMEMEPLEAPSIGYRLDLSVYHFHPAIEQVREWYKEAGLSIEEERKGEAYVHILARKKG